MESRFSTGWYSSSKNRTCSASSVSSQAATSSTSCATRETPTTGEVIAGLPSSYARATCAGDLPYSPATLATRSAMSKVAAPW